MNEVKEPKWVDQYDKFIKVLVNGHLPDCRKLTGHSCDCWHKQISKKQEGV